MEPDRIDELIAGYALCALSEDDERELEEHLRRSPEAREELAAFQETTAALAFGAEAKAPPPRLREQILEQVRPAPASNVVQFPRRRWLAPALGAAAAAAAGVAIGLGIWGSDLSGSLSDEQAAAAKQNELIALFARPDSSRYDLSGANGTLVVAPGGQAGLVLSGLSPAPSGKTYQAWVIDGDTVQSAGLFSGGGQAIVPLAVPVPGGATVAVTVEKAGGAAAPTQQPSILAATV